MATVQSTSNVPDTRFFGHPRGLSTCFFTEMGERFSFYGNRALLILYMTASPANGGLGFNDTKAGIIFGLYMSSVYLLSLPGGWMADRVLGARRAVLLGGFLIILGQLCLMASTLSVFYSGLLLVVLGTGLLKPNVSTIVGLLYPPGDLRRDSGFSVFYMGINLGAFLSPLICGWVGQKINWHYGFGLAGVGMVIGVVQYMLDSKHLGDAGLGTVRRTEAQRSLVRGIGVTMGAILALVLALKVLNVEITAQFVGNAFGVGLAIIAVGMFVWMIAGPGWSPIERKRALAILVLFVAACVFWSVFEQAGSSLSLFAERATNKDVFGFQFPASWYQALNALFIIGFAPVLGWVWLKLGPRDPSSPAKFALGLVFVGLGFAVLVPAAKMAGPQGRVGPGWLVITYLCHTFGELCISPVGLSAMTKLAPARVASLMMGLWFVSISVGDYLGGRAASLYSSLPLPTLFGSVAAFPFAAAIVLVLLIRPTVRLMSGVK